MERDIAEAMEAIRLNVTSDVARAVEELVQAGRDPFEALQEVQCQNAGVVPEILRENLSMPFNSP